MDSKSAPQSAANAYYSPQPRRAYGDDSPSAVGELVYYYTAGFMFGWVAVFTSFGFMFGRIAVFTSFFPFPLFQKGWGTNMEFFFLSRVEFSVYMGEEKADL